MSVAATVIAYGMACPLGLRAESAVAAMRAGIKVFEESDFVNDRNGDPACASMLSRIEPHASRSQRVLALAQRAMAEVCQPLHEVREVQRLPCFLSLPAPGHAGALDRDSLHLGLTQVMHAINPALSLELSPSHLYAQGRAGSFWALAAALDSIAQGRSWLALAGGVDSLVDCETLTALADENQLLCASQRDGLIPGEGAGFVLLAHPDLRGAARVGRIAGCSIVSAAAGEQTGIGNGLGRAFGQLGDAWAGRVDQVISAQTGQSKYERAFSYAYLRNDSLMPEPMRGVTIGATLGDTGAAAGALALVRACVGLEPPRSRPKRPPEHSSALVYGQSDGGSVGACILAGAQDR